MKKIYITIFTLVVLMISMTASVFAWFVEGQNKADVSGIQGTVMTPGLYIDVDSLIALDLEQIHSLAYLETSDFDEYKNHLKKFSSIVELTVLGSSFKEDTRITFEIESRLISIISGDTISEQLGVFYHITQDKSTFGTLSSNPNSITMNSNSKVIEFKEKNDKGLYKDQTVYIGIWGNGDLITQNNYQIAQIRQEIFINAKKVN